MFEKALRLKLRFDHKGMLNTEDLWDLPVEELDDYYVKLLSLAKRNKSLLNQEETLLDLKLSIVKHIVTTKLAEAKEHEQQKQLADKKHRLISILHEKQDEDYKSLSRDELIDEINKL